jgi:hypothetical protein
MRENRPTIMKTTVGVTFPRLSREPLMTEGEATPGDDRANPYRSVEEREYVERVRAKERERRDGQLWKSGLDDAQVEVDPPEPGVDFIIRDPTAGENDPFAFDDAEPDLPTLDFDGPRF